MDDVQEVDWADWASWFRVMTLLCVRNTLIEDTHARNDRSAGQGISPT